MEKSVSLLEICKLFSKDLMQFWRAVPWDCHSRIFAKSSFAMTDKVSSPCHCEGADRPWQSRGIADQVCSCHTIPPSRLHRATSLYTREAFYSTAPLLPLLLVHQENRAPIRVLLHLLSAAFAAIKNFWQSREPLWCKLRLIYQMLWDDIITLVGLHNLY